MPSMTLAQILEDVKIGMAGRSDLSDEFLVRRINEASVMLAQEADWDDLFVIDEFVHVIGFEGFAWEDGSTASWETGELAALEDETTVSDDKTITLNSRTKEVHTIRLITGDGESRKLTALTPRKFDELFPEPEFHAPMKPDYYCHRDPTTIHLFRIPDQNYTFKVYRTKMPTEFSLSDTSATFDLPDLTQALINFTLGLVWEALGEYVRAQGAFAAGKRKVETAKVANSRRPDVNRIPIHVGQGSKSVGEYWRDPFVSGVG